MNAITQQLADAVRLNLAGHFSVQKQTEALAAFDAAKDAPDARDAEIAALKHDLERTRDERNRARLEEEKRWKAAQPDLQPLHDLVKEWEHDPTYWRDFEYCSYALKEALAKIQSAGAVKPYVNGCQH